MLHPSDRGIHDYFQNGNSVIGGRTTESNKVCTKVSSRISHLLSDTTEDTDAQNAFQLKGSFQDLQRALHALRTEGLIEGDMPVSLQITSGSTGRRFRIEGIFADVHKAIRDVGLSEDAVVTAHVHTTKDCSQPYLRGIMSQSGAHANDISVKTA